MTMNDLKKEAASLVKEAKNYFTESKKNGVKNPTRNINVWSRKMGIHADVTYYVEMNNKKFGDLKSTWEIECFFKEVRLLLNELKTKRGYKYLTYETRNVGNYPCYYDIIERVGLMEGPCEGYSKLQKYLTKYGKYNLDNFKLYSVGMFGKRGILDSESGNRFYLDNNQKRCENYLETLRKHKGTKDNLVCKYVDGEVYIDEEERRASSYYECECHGEKTSYLKVDILTPSGKQKYSINLY